MWLTFCSLNIHERFTMLAISTWTQKSYASSRPKCPELGFLSSSCERGLSWLVCFIWIIRDFVANFQGQRSFFLIVFQYKHFQSRFLLEQRQCFSLQDPCFWLGQFTAACLASLDVLQLGYFVALQTRLLKRLFFYVAESLFHCLQTWLAWFRQSYSFGHWTTRPVQSLENLGCFSQGNREVCK